LFGPLEIREWEETDPHTKEKGRRREIEGKIAEDPGGETDE